jgi:hypothetical protein
MLMQTEKHDSKAKLSINKSTEISLFCEKLYIYILKEETPVHLLLIRTRLRFFFEKLSFLRGGPL